MCVHAALVQSEKHRNKVLGSRKSPGWSWAEGLQAGCLPWLVLLQLTRGPDTLLGTCSRHVYAVFLQLYLHSAVHCVQHTAAQLF